MTTHNTTTFSKTIIATLTILIFTGLSSAAVTTITANSAEDIDIGQESVDQDVTFQTTIDGASSTETVIINVSNVLSKSNVDNVNITDTSDVSLDSGDTGEVSVTGVTDNAVENDDDNTIDIELSDDTGDTDHTVTVTATLNLNTDGQSTDTGITYTVQDNNDDSDTTSFDLVKPNTINVATDNDNSLQYAVDNVVSDGSVTVESGTYDESVTVDTSDLDILGANSNKAFDESRSSEAIVSPSSGKAFDINAEGVSVKGFTIEGAQGSTVIETSSTANSDSTETEIKNNIIQPNSTGVSDLFTVRALGQIYFEENKISEGSNSDAFGIRSKDGDDISDSDIEDSLFTDLKVGVQTEDDGNVRIRYNDFSDLSASGVYAVSNGGISGAVYKVNSNDFDNVGNAVDFYAKNGDFTGNFIEVKYNDITNSNGLDIGAVRAKEDSQDLSTINAKGNYWGAASPDFNTLVNGDIEVTPWLESPRTPLETDTYRIDDSGSIQEAVQFTNSDDTVRLEEGTYSETVDMGVNSNVTVESVGSTDNTVVDADGKSDYAFDVTKDDTKINGLTIKSDENESAIYQSATGLRVENSDVVVDATSENSFGIDSEGSLTVDNSYFTDDNDNNGWSAGDSADSSFGVTTRSGVSSLTVKNSEFGNLRVGIQTRGGLDATLEDNDFHDIFASAYYATTANSEVSSSDSISVKDNTIGDVGEGIDLNANTNDFDLSSVQLRDNSFLNADADYRDGSYGHAVQVNGDGAQLSNSVDAKQNYWNAASGPSNDGEGNGDSISDGNGEINFRPWLLEENGDRYDVTFDLDQGEYEAFSPGSSYENVEVKESGSSSKLEYREGEWQSVDLQGKSGSAGDAFFTKNVKAVGYDTQSSEQQISVSLPNDSWTFIGGYDNGDQEVQNAFGMVGGDSEVQTIHHADQNIELVDRNDAPSGTSNNVNSGMNLAFDGVSTDEVSEFDGYWMRNSEETTLSTVPQPGGQ